MFEEPRQSMRFSDYCRLQSLRRRFYRQCHPESVLLNMRQLAEKSYVERIEIYNTPVAKSNMTYQKAEPQPVGEKRQTRVLPNILRNSASKSMPDSTNSLPISEPSRISGKSLPECSQETAVANTEGGRRQSRKRKQDYGESNIRQDPTESQGVKYLALSADVPMRRRSEMAMQSDDKKREKERLRSLESDSSEDTEDIDNIVSLPMTEYGVSVYDTRMRSSIDEVSYHNEYPYLQAKESVSYDGFIDFSGNDIFSKCYYDSYSKYSIDSSLELNDRLDDIQTILDSSMSCDASVKQFDEHIDRVANEKLPDWNRRYHDVDFSPYYELSPEEQIWRNEWLYGKEMELDAIFENNHIRDIYAERSTENYDLSFAVQDHLLHNRRDCPAENSDTDTAETDIPSELLEDPFDFPGVNVSLTMSNEEKDQILDVNLTETLMQEIDDIDSNDLFMVDTDHSLLSDKLTEVMLSALMQEAYPTSKDDTSDQKLQQKEVEHNSQNCADVESLEVADRECSEEMEAYFDHNDSISDNELRDAGENCRNFSTPVSGTNITTEEVEMLAEVSRDSTGTSVEANILFTTDIDTSSTSNDEKQMPDAAVPLSEEKNKRQTFECLMCPNPLQFHHRRTLSLHLEAAHKGLYNISCEICGRCFNKRYTYNRHVRNCSRVMFQCDDCDKEYRYKSSLVSHRKLKHKKTSLGELKTYVCEVCSKSYKMISRYNNHMRSHEKRW